MSVMNSLFGKAEKERNAPIGSKGLSDIQKIVSSGKSSKVNGVEIDKATARVFVEVYSQLSDQNKSKLLGMNILTATDTVWKLKNK